MTAHPFDVVARVLSERLHGGPASAALRAMVRASGIDWELVIGHASAQLVLPAFAAALRDLQLTRSLDPELGAFLEAVHAANLERNSELRDDLAAAVGVLNRVGIEPVLLKGAIRLCESLYPDDGWRVLRDLDLLVAKAELAQAIRALEEAGYAPAGRSPNQLRRPGTLAQIDLHDELFSTSSQVRLLTAAEVLRKSRPIEVGGRAARLPSIEHQLIHLIGHGQLKNFGHALGHVAWRDRLEAAALAQWAPGPIDWAALATRFAAAGHRRPWRVFVLALGDGALAALPTPRKVGLLTALQERRIAWQARSRTLAQISFWPIWCVALLRIQIEEREGGRPKLITTLRRLFFEHGAGQRMLRVLLYGAPRPWMLVLLSPPPCL
jgi:hypothetical protein